ncbi:unnamed protein product, partial [Rotaria magnacalcarata]
VAADGFTYEREAITKWFETSNRSPMTNQELEDLELKPNFAIKSILQALQGANSLPAKLLFKLIMNDENFLHEAINNSKEFVNFPGVLMAVSLHSEWLTMIPEGRAWAILHQVIFSGNVNNLNQLLALQKSNKKFRLLTNTRDNKTVLDIASIRHDTSEMKMHIEKLIKLDEMLNYAKGCQWKECYEIVKENPGFSNEKPPYRLYYLIHHMACADAMEEFNKFKEIKNCKFDLNLRANRLKINKIAEREQRPAFARFIEREYPSLLDEDVEPEKPSEEARRRTVTISNIMETKIIAKTLDDNLMGAPVKPERTRTEVMTYMNQMRNQSERELQEKEKELKEKHAIQLEKTLHQAMLLDNLVCPIALTIFTDPVIAADGFTYERSAIERWLTNNDRSPMTNQVLPNKLLNPNTVIKQIITAVELMT